MPRSVAGVIYGLKQYAGVPSEMLEWHGHNDFYKAVVNAATAWLYGCGAVNCTLFGIGERTGNASLEEVALNLFANYGVETIDLSKIGKTRKIIERITGFPIAYNKPIVGRNAFAHESGIHVHGVMNNTSTYEPYLPELVGVDRHFVLGKHSGLHSVKGRLDELGIKFPEERMHELMQTVKDIAVGGKEIDDVELMAIVDHILWNSTIDKQVVKLDGITVFTGKGIRSTATVTVDIDGQKKVDSKTGVGPVDAALNAISGAVNEAISLEEYKLAAITGKSDSICEVTVMIRNVQNDGNLSVGKAVGSDIVQTSVDAMMVAINRDYARRGV
jgi:2-isopropylmalate synthase